VAVVPQLAVDTLKGLCADVVIDYTQSDLKEKLNKIGLFDLVFDYSGQRNEMDYIRYLRPGEWNLHEISRPFSVSF